MKVPIGILVAEMVGLIVGYALLLFVPAGTLRWWPGWAFIIIFFGGGALIVIWLLKHNPGLMVERMTGMGNPGQQSWDKWFFALFIPFYLLWLVIMPLDAVRFHWSHIPFWLQLVGLVIFVVSMYMLFLVYRENSFLSPAARIQTERGQTVISTGPYRIVRHPMYATFLVQFIGVSLMAGSWAGLAGGLLFSAAASYRAVLEERMLSAELPGYKEYMARVRYRMIPGVW